MEELAEVLAGHLVRRAPLLRMAGNQGLQDAHPGAAVALPRLHPLLRLRRQPAQAGCCAVEDRRARHPRRDAVAGLPVARNDGCAQAAAAARYRDRRAAGGNPHPARLSVHRGPRLPEPRPPVTHAFRRRGAAHQPHDGTRHFAGEYVVRAGRAIDRTAPARHGARDRRDAAPQGRRQHAGRGRARSADHASRRPPAGHRPGRRLARRRSGVRRPAGRHRDAPTR
jgi:hypothetical protein